MPLCLVPLFGSEYGEADEEYLVPVTYCDLIVIMQSCDLENKKVTIVALCPIHTTLEFQEQNPSFAKRGRWENVRKGRQPELHMPGSASDPSDNRSALVVDSGRIIGLPIAYLVRHAVKLGERNRFVSPFWEHFSQAFARFFMRVGLPSSIPPFKQLNSYRSLLV